MVEKEQSAKSIWLHIKNYVRLNIENAKLTVTEKLTVLFVSVAFFSIALVLIIFGLVFLSIAVANILSTVMPSYWAYIIIAVFYFILLGLLFAFKQALFLNPISRFLSKLLFNHPDDN